MCCVCHVRSFNATGGSSVSSVVDQLRSPVPSSSFGSTCDASKGVLAVGSPSLNQTKADGPFVAVYRTSAGQDLNMVCTLQSSEPADAAYATEVFVFDVRPANPRHAGARQRVALVLVASDVGYIVYELVSDGNHNACLQTTVYRHNMSAADSRSVTFMNDTITVWERSLDGTFVVAAALVYCPPDHFKVGNQCLNCATEWYGTDVDVVGSSQSVQASDLVSPGGLQTQCSSCRSSLCVNASDEESMVVASMPITANVSEFVAPGEKLWVTLDLQGSNGNNVRYDVQSFTFDPTPPVLPTRPTDVYPRPADSENGTWDIADVNFTAFADQAAVSWSSCFDSESGIVSVVVCVHDSFNGAVLRCSQSGTDINANDTPVWLLDDEGYPLFHHAGAYFFRVTCTNGAGLESFAETDGFRVDLTPPTITVANDGYDLNGYDVDNSNVGDCLFAVFDSHAELAPVVAYDIATFSVANGSVVTPWTRIDDGHMWSECELPLVQGEAYFAEVVAWNAAGVNSSSMQTDGMFIGLSEIEVNAQQDTAVMFDVVSANPNATVPPIQGAMNIPAGAFANGTELVCGRADDEASSLEAAVSAEFTLGGYAFSISLSNADPDGVARFAKPVEICLDYDYEASNDEAPAILVFNRCAGKWFDAGESCSPREDRFDRLLGQYCVDICSIGSALCSTTQNESFTTPGSGSQRYLFGSLDRTRRRLVSGAMVTSVFALAFQEFPTPLFNIRCPDGPASVTSAPDSTPNSTGQLCSNKLIRYPVQTVQVDTAPSFDVDGELRKFEVEVSGVAVQFENISLTPVVADPVIAISSTHFLPEFAIEEFCGLMGVRLKVMDNNYAWETREEVLRINCLPTVGMKETEIVHAPKREALVQPEFADVDCENPNSSLGWSGMFATSALVATNVSDMSFAWAQVPNDHENGYPLIRNTSAPELVVSDLISGTYTFRLDVSDRDNAVVTRFLDVVVAADDGQLPTCSATCTCWFNELNDDDVVKHCDLDASASIPPASSTQNRRMLLGASSLGFTWKVANSSNMSWAMLRAGAAREFDVPMDSRLRLLLIVEDRSSAARVVCPVDCVDRDCGALCLAGWTMLATFCTCAVVVGLVLLVRRLPSRKRKVLPVNTINEPLPRSSQLGGETNDATQADNAASDAIRRDESGSINGSDVHSNAEVGKQKDSVRRRNCVNTNMAVQGSDCGHSIGSSVDQAQPCAAVDAAQKPGSMNAGVSGRQITVATGVAEKDMQHVVQFAPETTKSLDSIADAKQSKDNVDGSEAKALRELQLARTGAQELNSEWPDVCRELRSHSVRGQVDAMGVRLPTVAVQTSNGMQLDAFC